MIGFSSSNLISFRERTRSAPALARARRGLRLARPLLQRASARITARVPVAEALLGTLDPTLSLHRILARVVEVRAETEDVTSFVLAPNARFGTFRPGSFVPVRVTIAGKVVERAYSLSSAPSPDGRVTLTIKRVPGGLVSNHLADSLVVGDVIELGAPTGEFVLPREVPGRLVLLSAGSGITPVMSMLRHLVATGARTEVTFVHFARSPADVIFAAELQQLAARAPNVRVVLSVERPSEGWTGSVGRFGIELLERVAPDFREVETYLCGPAPFMQSVLQGLEAAGADLGKAHLERFDAGLDPAAFLSHSQVISFSRAGVVAISSRPLTVLQEAEARGVKLASGCRAGTCGTCRCRKTRGVVVNVVTGEESGPGEEMISACVSVARGSVEVDL